MQIDEEWVVINKNIGLWAYINRPNVFSGCSIHLTCFENDGFLDVSHPLPDITTRIADIKRAEMGKYTWVHPNEASLPEYSMEEIGKHRDDVKWTAIDGYVYDITSWAKIHPGGELEISSFSGQDASVHISNYYYDYLKDYSADQISSRLLYVTWRLMSS